MFVAQPHSFGDNFIGVGASKLEVQVAPIGIALLDELDLPGSPPTLDTFFARDRVDDQLMSLVPNQLVDIVFGREPDRYLCLVLIDTPQQVIGNAAIERTVTA